MSDISRSNQFVFLNNLEKELNHPVSFAGEQTITRLF